MKKSLLLIITAIAVLFYSCDSKKTSTEDTAKVAEESKTIVLGSDAEIKEGQNVFIISPEDGSMVNSPFAVEMGVNGMEVEAAGELASYKGHHHIIIDDNFVPKGEVVATDSTHLHFGKGQTNTELRLAPGSHTIRLQFADGFHRSYGEKMSAVITVIVE